MYPGNDAYEKSAKEFVTMKHLHEVGYPVPQVHHLERENSPWGKPFVPHHLPLSDKKLNAELVGKLTFVSVPPDSVMGTLINDITAESQSFILVLDDYHLITTPAIHQAMAYLCEHNQPQMQLVIISRADRPISISRLLVRGQFGR
jgi:hypothetical protein